MSGFTDEQIERALALAIEDHNFEMAVGLLRMLAVQNPLRAGMVYEMIQSVIDMRLGETGGAQ